MNIFKPWLHVVKRKDGTVSVFATTMTPNQCFEPGTAEEGAPDGQIVLEQNFPVTLNINYVPADFCGMALKPIYHFLTNLEPAENQDTIFAFALLDGKVVGTSTAPIPAAEETGIDIPGRLLPFPIGFSGEVGFLEKTKLQDPIEALNLGELPAEMAEETSRASKVRIAVTVTKVAKYAIWLNDDNQNYRQGIDGETIRFKLPPGNYELHILVRGPKGTICKVEIEGDAARLFSDRFLVFDAWISGDGIGKVMRKIRIK
ncbi:MAG: hypothetical protein GY765_00400 [bacterium]|nr:hypothetical protein [bacterium]